MNLQNSSEKPFQDRNFQKAAWKSMRAYLSKYLHNELEAKPEGQISNNMLIHMATGSGKTATVGKFVNDVFELRRKFMKINKTKDVPRIHAIVLNDRKSLVNQLKVDFLEGREEGGKTKAPLIDKKYSKTITSKIFHSDAEKIFHEDDELLLETGNIEVKEEGHGKDSFTFATFQTAIKGLPGVEQPNLIIVDEAHHLTGATYYESFMNFYKPDVQGVYPLVILMTATPNKILYLTGDPLVQFGLPEWILHKDSPKVNYKLVTNNQITPEDIERINSEISRISQIQDLKEKKRQIQILKEGEDGQGGINAMLRRYNSNDELVLDLLERVENLDHTIIFCPNIEIVDQVTSLINFYTGDENTAIPFHSKIDEADDSVLAKYNSGQSKVIVAVGKLNEGIDMPQTNNVVFWRETESPTIFQQQFGRGLRGDEVNIYDYVGGIRNLAWINSINESIDEIVSTDEEKTKESTPTNFNDTREKEIKHISIVMEGVGDVGQGVQHTVDLQDIVSKMQDLELTCDLTKEMVEAYFKDKNLEEMKKLTNNQRRELKIGGNGFYAVATLYGIEGNPAVNKEIWYNLLEQIYGEKIKRIAIQQIVALLKDPTAKESWYTLGSSGRQKYKLNIGGQEISYIQICRYFGYKESINDLYKDEIFDQVSKEIYGEGYYEYLERIKGVDLTLTGDEMKVNIVALLKDPRAKESWYNLGNVGRQKYKLNIGGQEISYIQICRYFGYKESKSDLYKDEIFDQVSKEIYGEGYYEHWKENIKEALKDPEKKNVWYNSGAASRMIYKLNIGGQEISYVQICRYFGYKESINDLCKNEIFNKLTQMIFGD